MHFDDRRDQTRGAGKGERPEEGEARLATQQQLPEQRRGKAKQTKVLLSSDDEECRTVVCDDVPGDATAESSFRKDEHGLPPPRRQPRARQQWRRRKSQVSGVKE